MIWRGAGAAEASALVVALTVAAGCSALNAPGAGGGDEAMSAPARTIRATPQQIAAAAELAFRRFGIPVEGQTRDSGYVTSGRFEVDYRWDGEPIERRIDCGDSPGIALSTIGPISLSISLSARPVGTVGPGANMFGREGSSMAMLTASIEQMHSRTGSICKLTQPFADQILDAVQELAGRS